MKSNSTQYTPRGGYEDRRRMQPGRETPIGPIINWAALWSRIWLFLKRLVAELWYLVSRRQPVKAPARASRNNQNGPGIILFRKWSLPLFKVAAALALFFYVMQRDIQFSIQMKAPFAQSTGYSEEVSQNGIEAMGFAQTVGLGSSSKSAAKSEALDLNAVEDYLDRFAQVAQTEMEKYGIPASIKMAQAILESRAGQAMDAKVDNNHFGKPMAGQPYESAWRNWREHSLLLVNRHPDLLKHDKDFRAWARGLEKAGYNKSPNYANQLLEIIDRFHLEQLDDPTI
ncbi:glucosaminidase domain-containing protein [Lewinella sp. LCG006]|uniref:glucosaminidase domain-containing protein n=1 Tax=Lewinella sp. LCG006 TaxID=3231911 RepID=UPI0034612FF8